MLNKHPIFKLFIIAPVGFLVSYILVKMGSSNITSYFLLLSSILLLYRSAKMNGSWGLPVGLGLYFVFNVFFTNDYTANARESITFIFYLATLYSTSFLIEEIDRISYEELRKFFIWFAVLFVSIFVFTALIEGVKKTEDVNTGVERVYYNGFVISHHFSYITILLAFIMLKFNNRVYFAAGILLALFVGNRISLLVLISTALIFFESISFNTKKIALLSTRVVVFLLCLGILYVTLFESVFFSWKAISSFLLDSDNIAFTSGRYLFWYNGLDAISKVPIFSFNFFFGLGPDSVEKLANELYDTYYWMHNDYMQIYYCYGVVGIFLYIHALIFFSKQAGSYNVIWVILITGMLNGFYTYGALQLIIMILVINKRFQTNSNTIESKVAMDLSK